MGRTLKNTLTEAELLARFTEDDTDVLARYGIDLLGRAIGHEMRSEKAKGLPPTLFYSNLIHELVPQWATGRVMAFTAAREVMAL